MGDIASYSIEEIARRLGGKVHRDARGPYVLAPGPGHTAGDKACLLGLARRRWRMGLSSTRLPATIRLFAGITSAIE